MSSLAHRRIAAAMLTKIGPALGVGGSAWQVFAPTSDGLGPVAYALAGAWEGYVMRRAEVTEGQSGPGVIVGADRWEAHGAAAGVVTPGCVIVSAAEPGRAYLIGSPIDVVGYVQWQVTPASPPSVEA